MLDYVVNFIYYFFLFIGSACILFSFAVLIHEIYTCNQSCKARRKKNIDTNKLPKHLKM